MSTVSENDEIEDAAARWVLRADRGALPEDEQRALDAWLDSDPRHRGAFVRAQAIWADLDRVAALNAGDTPAIVACSERRRFMRAASIAGAFLAIALAGFGASRFYLAGREATDRGEIRRIALDDGSAIVLNTSSVVNVRFTEHERRVVLRTGEASFGVAHDAQRPFIVQARDVSVKAVGTNFSVRLRPGDIAVTVTEGVVEVVRGADRPNAATQKQRVGRNQQAIAAPTQPIATASLDQDEIARRLAWEEGRLVFDGELLAQAVTEVNRYSSVAVVIDDPQLRAKSFVGVFRVGDARGFAFAAAAAFDARVREEGDQLHLVR